MSGGAPPDLLGKDEVASSNLASSSKKKPRTPTGFRLSSFLHHMVSTPKTDTETDTAMFSHAKIYYNRLPCRVTTPEALRPQGLLFI